MDEQIKVNRTKFCINGKWIFLSERDKSTFEGISGITEGVLDMRGLCATYLARHLRQCHVRQSFFAQKGFEGQTVLSD